MLVMVNYYTKMECTLHVNFDKISYKRLPTGATPQHGEPLTSHCSRNQESKIALISNAGNGAIRYTIAG